MKDGIEAAGRLWEIANGYSGQCRYVAAFLLGLYNGSRFPFDLNNFRCLDRDIFADCLILLEMDYRPKREIHEVLGVTGEQFEALAKAWRQ